MHQTRHKTIFRERTLKDPPDQCLVRSRWTARIPGFETPLHRPACRPVTSPVKRCMISSTRHFKSDRERFRVHCMLSMMRDGLGYVVGNFAATPCSPMCVQGTLLIIHVCFHLFFPGRSIIKESLRSATAEPDLRPLPCIVGLPVCARERRKEPLKCSLVS
jgi:hypothetical protein